MSSATHHRHRAAARRRHLRVESLEERRLLAFDLLTEIPTTTVPIDVVLTRVDGDSHVDMIIGGTPTSAVRLGNGDGTFGDPISIGVSGKVATGDLNGDSHLDLVMIQSASLVLLLGNGDGTFQAPQAIPLPMQTPPAGGDPLFQYPSAAVVGDINDDGKMDLVAGGITTFTTPGYISCGYYSCTYGNFYHHSSYANVLVGNGAGEFTYVDHDPSDADENARHLVTHVTTPLFGTHIAPISALMGDLDSDGHADVVIETLGGVSALLGDGTGVLGSAIASPSGRLAPFLGDVDGDGMVDAVSRAGNSLTLHRGQGNGQFVQSPVAILPHNVDSAVVGDVNADGKLDIVAVGSTFSCTSGYYYCYESVTLRDASVLLGTGGGVFAAPQTTSLGTVANYSSLVDVALADLTGDGLVDLVALDGSLSVALIAEGNWPPADAPFIRIEGATVLEGNTGAQEVEVTISLSAPYSAPVSANFHTLSGSAQAGSDFAELTGSVVFAPGETSQTITLLVHGDRNPEQDETFSIVLTGVTNALQGSHTPITVRDNEPRISVDHTLYINPLTVNEGDGGTTPAVFTISLAVAYDQEVSVSYASSTGHVNDIIAASGTLRFAPGETSKTVTVQVINDLEHEGLEAFNLDLFNASPTATIVGGGGYCYIVDNDPLPTVTINDVSRVEGNSGVSRFVFTVTLSAPTQGAYVEYATANGSATTANKDYVAKYGYAYFEDGSTTTTISIDVRGDKTKEANETFYVELLSAGGATILDGRGMGTIVNDDGSGPVKPPKMRVNDVTVTEAKNEVKRMNFTVTLTAASDEPVEVSYATRNGTARASGDYIAASGILTFAPGETSKSISIFIQPDNKSEPDEYFYLMLDDLVGAQMWDNIGRGVIRSRT